MRETSRLFILISAYEGGVGHVYSQSRGRGKRKIFSGGAPDPDIFCPPPPIKIPGGATGLETITGEIKGSLINVKTGIVLRIPIRPQSSQRR